MARTLVTARSIGNAIDRLAVQVVRRASRLDEHQRLAFMQALANMDDLVAFDAVISSQTATATVETAETP